VESEGGNMDIIEKLEDLIKQATEERTHYYVKSVCEEAIEEIKGLRDREAM
jgi:hypothetical protein